MTAQPTLKIDWNGLYCSYVMIVAAEPEEDPRETGDPGGDAERVELRREDADAERRRGAFVRCAPRSAAARSRDRRGWPR